MFIIHRQININNYSVNDFLITDDGFVKILSVRDGELFLDVVDLNKASSKVKLNPIEAAKQITNYYDSPFRSIDF
jgi:hypothetical protein